MSRTDFPPSTDSLWQEILCKHVEYNNVHSPSKPSFQVSLEALQQYHSLKWVSSIKPSYLSISNDDQIKLSKIHGPDLDSIPRTRYTSKTRVMPSQGKSKPSGYNIFYKEQSLLFKEGHDFKEMAKLVSQNWASLDKVEKEKYKVKAQNSN